MNPKHQKVASDREAHAPYNFVPLPEAIVKVDLPPSHDRYSGYTGRITCTLTTETPLYIRCGMSPEAFRSDGEKAFHELSEQQKLERAQFFFGADPDKPLIPGSSLRGMLRNLIEIVGYGKQQWVTDELLVYRAVGDPTSLGEFYRRQVLGGNKSQSPNTHVDYPTRNLRAGYLAATPTGWAIRPAVEHLGETFVHVEYSASHAITGGHGRQALYDVFVVPAQRRTLNRGRRGPGDLILDVAITSAVKTRSGASGSPPAGMVPGVLVESGHMGGPHPKHWHCVIYEPDPTASLIEIPSEMWRIYESDRELTRGSTTPTRKLTASGDPLFYLVDNRGQLVFFGPTMMFRLPYPSTPLSGFVPENLRRERDIDFAEAIFGYTKSDEVPEAERAHAGRVSISDGVFKTATGEVWLNPTPITPKVLGSPKPTSFQLYLTQQEPNDRRRLDHYASPPPHSTVIRGHKLYWHQAGATTNHIAETDHNKITRSPKQFTRIKPVARGVSFSFTIHFENLRDFELGALLWAVTLPGKSSGTYRHKLGMGKPLGLGSVHITGKLTLSHRYADECNNVNPRYKRAFNGGDWYMAESQNADVQPFLDSFEKYVLTRIHPIDRAKAERLSDVPRIEMLLAMLSWPGPDRNKVSYMTVEPFNEYRNRPVLPDPLAVLAGQPVQPPTPMHQQVGPQPQAPVAKTAPATPVTQPPLKPEEAPPASPMPVSSVLPKPAIAQPQVLAPPPRAATAQSQAPASSLKPASSPPAASPIREATVVRVEGSFITVELDGEEINIQLDQLAEPGGDQRARSRLYPIGSKIKVRDLGLSSKGKRRLTTKL